jgi:hypothetical protein
LCPAVLLRGGPCLRDRAGGVVLPAAAPSQLPRAIFALRVWQIGSD